MEDAYEERLSYEENEDTDSSEPSFSRVIRYEIDEYKQSYVDNEHSNCFHMEEERVKCLEEQQEVLNTSLLALTSHFAQVQLRLKQIVSAPSGMRETLLTELEEFAFRGIPDTTKLNNGVFEPFNWEQVNCEETLEAQRIQQNETIERLKAHLEEIEKYAYETGEAGLPQCVLIERQKVVIDQLKGKLNLEIDQIDNLSVDELKSHVDVAVNQLVNPMKMKEQLVLQLKTQIADLERFITFLQVGSGGGKEVPGKRKECACMCHGKNTNRPGMKAPNVRQQQQSSTENELRTKTLNIMKRIIALLHMFAGSEFGCDVQGFSKNSLKKTMKANHWGDLRADLELVVNEILQVTNQPVASADSDYLSDSDSNVTVQCNSKLASAVRKRLAPSIQKLMQHGLMAVGQSVSLVPFMACFPQRINTTNCMHAWELILKFYELKNGEKFNSTPARKLSMSFNLDIGGGGGVSGKQSLLSTVGNIIATHSRYKRSYDSHFKALVCAGLNTKMLVIWLRLIFRSHTLIELYYQPWSYVVKTGFEDSFTCLEKLYQYQYDLPVDLAVRQLQNIKDAF